MKTLDICRVLGMVSSLVLFLTLRVVSTEYPPEDHQGQDLIFQNQDVIWGVHQGIGNFEIPTSVTVNVKFYDPKTTGTGFLEIQAEQIHISGVLNAHGAGLTGGYGGLGIGGKGCVGVRGLHELIRDLESFVQAAIGLQFDAEDGGYDCPKSNCDQTSDTSLHMGGGGEGGGGIKGSDAQCDFFRGCSPATSGSGGGGGGNGGAAIFLIAKNLLEIQGKINNSGATGQNGQEQYAGYIYINWVFKYCSCLDAGNSDGGGPTPFEEGLGGYRGGAGAGGGILLYCLAPNGIHVSGELDLRGGRNQLSNGGTIKIFSREAQPIEGTVHAARIYYAPALPAQTPTPTQTPTQTETPTPIPSSSSTPNPTISSPSPTLIPTDISAYILGTSSDSTRCDVNRDGVVDVADILHILLR